MEFLSGKADNNHAFKDYNMDLEEIKKHNLAVDEDLSRISNQIKEHELTTRALKSLYYEIESYYLDERDVN